MKSRGLAVAKNTIFEYLDYLEDAALIFLLPKREASLRKQEHNPKKLHVIEVDLCDGAGSFFINCCWSLGDPATLGREKAVLAFAARQFPKADGTLLYHEYTPGLEQEIPNAMAAWRYLLA